MLHRVSAVIILFFFPFFLFPEVNFWSEIEDGELINNLSASMSDEELLGQVFLLGFMTKTPSQEILRWISERQLGGVKIFGWNVGDLKTLGETIGKMQEEAAETRLKIPLFIATDQEGGWVRHIKVQTSITPGNMAVAATGLYDDAYKTGYYIGIELRALGINMNFAPTVDVYVNPEAHVIGPRAFSSDPVQTALNASAFFHGMESTGVICTAKHFPGHGNADKDSHGELPIIHNSYEELWNRDIVPYRFLIKEGLPAIMSGHLSFPEILGNNTPASLSSWFLTDLLRKQLNYKGLVITDDMQMNGVQSKNTPLPEICRQALMAGNDIIMISRYPETHEWIWQTLIKYMKTDNAFKEQIIRSVKRILATKIRYLKGDNSVPLIPDIRKIDENIPNPEGQNFFFEQACRSITIVEPARIPLENTNSVLLVGYYNSFFAEGTNYYPDADTLFLKENSFYQSDVNNITKILSAAAKYDSIIFCLSNPGNLEVLKQLESIKSKLTVLSVHTPVYLQEVTWVSSVLALYGTGNDSFAAGFAVLNGDYTPSGTLPIDILQWTN